MKNNKAMTILLPLVVVVWGVIAYRLVAYIKTDSVVAAPEKDEINVQIEGFKPDSFSIVANYRDPFAGNSYQPIQKIIPFQTPVPKIIKWPVIIFKGIIKNQESQKTYGLLSIGGKIKSVMVKDETEGVKIMDLNKDDITVSFNNERRTFKKINSK